MTTITDTTTSATAPGFWRRYGALWKGAPRELLVIVALFVIAQTAVGIGWGLFSAGVGLLPVFLLGVFVIVAALYAARGIGWLNLVLIEWTGRPRIPRPVWRREAGFLGWLRSMFASPHYWLYLSYSLLPQLVLSIVSFTVAMTCLGIAVGGTLWAFWAWSLNGLERNGGLAWLIERWLGVDGRLLEGVAYTVLGLLFAFLLPFVTRGLSWAHWGLARLMLGSFRDEELERQLAGAQASRAAAVSAEDTALRRLERDIHDGPQQRLVRLQMDIASADRRIGDSPEEARALLASAAEQAREALEELRALSRGFAPPILLDRGLIAALQSAAARSAVPVEVVDGIPAGLALPPELERNAYFIASEGLVNAVKHAGATQVELRVEADAARRLLSVTVRDDGRGGAVPVPGHGLAGLEERVRGLGGELSLDSPESGPTVLAARLPW